MTKEELKKAVDKIGRKQIADKIGVPYGTLSGKLNGFIPLTEEEKSRIEQTLTEKE